MSGRESRRPKDAESPRRGWRAAGRVAAVGTAVLVAAAGVWGLSRATAAQPAPSAQDIPALSVRAVPVEPGSAVPDGVRVTANVSPRPAHGSHRSSSPSRHGKPSGVTSLGEWGERVSAATGIPVRALRAYGRAALALRKAAPGCHLSWSTLAGIGRVESNHGRYGGAVILPDGNESKPIVGVPLNGSRNVAAIGDTDHGSVDGDRTHDRAVGPMQFIPSTWRKYASDGNGDGKGNPQNIDDAALGAAHYLCAGGRDMGKPRGWWSGLMSYNHSVAYGQKVFGLAGTYAHEAKSALS